MRSWDDLIRYPHPIRKSKNEGVEMVKILSTFRTKYLDETNVRLIMGQYGNGQLAMQVFSEIGEPLTTPTVNLEAYNEMPRDGYVFIYGDYSEHVGVQKALQDAGIIGPIERTINMGGHDATAYECQLLLK